MTFLKPITENIFKLNIIKEYIFLWVIIKSAGISRFYTFYNAKANFKMKSIVNSLYCKFEGRLIKFLIYRNFINRPCFSSKIKNKGIRLALYLLLKIIHKLSYYFKTIKSSPAFTCWPSLTLTDSTLPDKGAVMLVSIFIASIIITD